MRILHWCALALLLSWTTTASAQTEPAADEEMADEGTAEGEEAEEAAEPEPEPEPEGPLKVGVSGSEPFIIREGDALTGISIAIWEAMAEELEREYELVEVETPNEAIARVEAGELDLAVGPLSISSARARRVAFTQPYYESAISIAAPAVEPGLVDRLAPFFSRGFFGGAGALFLVLLIVGAVLWAVERKKNETISEKPIAGIATGIWLALVTMTTVGYGDRVPETPVGRAVTGLWMLISLVLVSSLTAFLATALTVSSLDSGAISTAEDLGNRKVAVVDGTTSVPFARRYGANLVREDELAGAVAAVMDGRAEAVVYDRPILQWQLHQLEDHGLTVSDNRYEPLGYGFALNHSDSDLSHELDAILLSLYEADRVEAIIGEWL
jgi:polar amino acid transport system substrate-binding protein